MYVCECECVLVGLLAHIEGPPSLLKAKAILSVRCNPPGDHLLHINAKLCLNVVPYLCAYLGNTVIECIYLENSFLLI